MAKLLEISDRDCTLYSVVVSDEMLIDGKINSFDELTLEERHSKFSIYIYCWQDPIRFNDKVISKNTKKIKFLWFHEENTLCFFANSESDLYYVTSKLVQKCKWILHKKLQFQNRLDAVFSNSSFFSELISVVIKRQIGDVEKLLTISVNQLSREKKLNLISRYEVCSLNYFFSGIYFSIDCNSVISFHDTDTFEEILIIVEGINNENYKHHQ
ncbi:hypothetical protein ACFQZE_08375 [Paenibacillus sp. GCM10027627]|uniref:hypothetical protein n=1 Tax=unclassified Paenibacillus TaxID=185978 RepID=UPI0036268B15